MAAERGSMTEAASALFIAQSAVSTAVARLEALLGSQLFIRQRSKGLILTASGVELLSRARAILDSVDDAVDAINPDSTTGRLRVACFNTLAPFYLPGIIDSLSSAFPELVTEISELSALEVEGALTSGAVEIALTYNLGLGPHIRKEALATIPLYAAVAHDHPLASLTTVSLADLAHEPMVLLDLPSSRDYFLEVFTERGFTPDVRYRFESFETVRAMVARGHGFTVLNQRPLTNATYDGGNLVMIPISDDIRGVQVVLASLASECRKAVTSPPSRMPLNVGTLHSMQ
jgi:DNA-binding transcriptional LysR family regulator